MKVPFGGVDILQPVSVPERPDPVSGTYEYECAVARDESTYKISAMPWLPQLPDVREQELHDRIEQKEREHAAPNGRTEDYILGTAEKDDDIASVGELPEGYLFTAEHATNPWSFKNNKLRSFADCGTAGLAAVLAEDFGTALIMCGRQTSNVPSDDHHPIKRLIAGGLTKSSGFVSVHGKGSGMFVHPYVRAEVHACIGLGLIPTEREREFAHQIVLAARDELGLYVVVSNDQPTYIQKRGDTAFKRNGDGTIKLSQLAALGPTYTANFSRGVLARLKREVPAFQIELTNLLRWTPLDGENGRKDRVARVMGVALGYKLLEKVVELTPEYSALESDSSSEKEEK